MVEQPINQKMRLSCPELGPCLRRLRNLTGLSQEKVAERVGVSWMTIHRQERNQRGVPRWLLEKLADLYEVELDTLIPTMAVPLATNLKAVA